ncbi:MAG: SDR family NAD(P)-dependent oxidoreductase [Pseudonocardia sp.]
MTSARASAATPGIFDLTGQVALVTGGNSGIGLGMARGLHAAGATVCIWGTNEERNAKAVAEIGERTHAARVDVGDEDAVAAAMARLVADHGRLDSCFANAGMEVGRRSLLDTSLDDFRRVTRVNLDGAFVTMREACRQMKDLGNGGSIVATSSLTVLFGQAGGYAYTSSKHALIGIVQAIAVEMARYQIRANALLPGWTVSGVTEDAFANEKFVANVMPRMPVRRWGVGEDFAGIAVYLASPASTFHTGDSILIDGGYAAF